MILKTLTEMNTSHDKKSKQLSMRSLKFLVKVWLLKQHNCINCTFKGCDSNFIMEHLRVVIPIVKSCIDLLWYFTIFSNISIIAISDMVLLVVALSFCRPLFKWFLLDCPTKLKITEERMYEISTSSTKCSLTGFVS